MPQYKVTLNATSITALKANLKKLGIEANVEKINSSPSRADRLSEAETMLEDAKGIVEELKDELEGWKDNLPENLQNGSKAEEIDEAVSALEEIVNNMESCEFGSVSFPGMY